jgi:hypothetical protein
MKILKFKRIFMMILSVALIAGVIPVSAATSFAATSEAAKVDYIVSNGVLSNEKAVLKSNDGTEYAVNIYETEERLLSVNSITNTKSYVKECAVVLDEDNIQLRSAGSTTKTKWDSTGGVKGTVTIYFDEVGSKYKITRATGSWINYDAPATTLSNHHYVIACYDGTTSYQYILTYCFWQV